MPNRLTPRVDLPEPTEGDDYSYAVTFIDGSGSPIDITDWTVSMTIADRRADSNTPLVERDITSHDNPTAGETSWGVPHADTKGIVGTKDYDIQVRKADGTIRTIAIGTIAFTDGVTDRDVPGSGGGTGANASAGASIDVTLGDDDTVSINVRGLTNYTDSDVLDAINGASISPGELSVSDSNPVTGGPVGDEGEYRLLTTIALSGQFSTTSTNYTDVMPSTSGLLLPLQYMDDQTNLGNLHVSLSCELWNNSPSTETTFARISGIWEGGDLTDTEVSKSAGGPVRAFGDRVPTATSNPESYTIEMRVTGGKGLIKRAGVNVWGVVQ